MLEGAVEMPVLLGGAYVSHDAYVPRVAAAQSRVVRQADVTEVLEGIEAHEARRDRIDGHLIGGCKDDVLDVGDHAARARPVPGEGAVHHGEHTAVDLLLDQQEIDQGLVDAGVGPVATLVQEPAERVLHRTGGGGENVGLHGREVDDVLPDEPPGDGETVRVDVVQADEALAGVPDRLPDVDPLLVLVQVHVLQTVVLHHR